MSLQLRKKKQISQAWNTTMSVGNLSMFLSHSYWIKRLKNRIDLWDMKPYIPSEPLKSTWNHLLTIIDIVFMILKQKWKRTMKVLMHFSLWSRVSFSWEPTEASKDRHIVPVLYISLLRESFIFQCHLTIDTSQGTHFSTSIK